MPHPVMLFAAGLGTRMGALTQDRPKPLLPVAGRALIDHALDLLDPALTGPVVVNLHYRGEMIRDHLQGRDVRFSPEQPEVLETGGGLRHALPLLGPEPVITLNSDAIWQGPSPIPALLEAWDPDRMDGLMMLVPRDRAVGHTGRGDFLMDDTGRLTRGPGAIYGGVQIVKTEGLAQISEQKFSLNLLWDQMLRANRLFGLTYPGHWCDVGRPEGITLAEQMIGHSHV